MTPAERARLLRWCTRHLTPYALGLFVGTFLGLCQAANILDPGNSGDEGWLVTVCLVLGPVALNAFVVGAIWTLPRVNRAVVRARGRSPHHPDADLRRVYGGER